MEMITSKSVGSGNCLDIGRLEATLRHDLVYDQVITAIGKPLADEAWRADVVVLDHEGAHGF